jgi:hypothetical protein
MNCADAEILICDWLDGTLEAGRGAELERHLAACANCAALAADARAAVGFMERASDVEPPPELINRILFEQRWKERGASGAGWRTWLRRLVQPVLQPRLAMGMALTIFSLAALARYVGPSRQLTPADFNPAHAWQSLDDRVYRAWQRTVKFYESIKFVYQVRSRLQEWNQQREEEQAAATGERKQNQAVDEKRLPVKNAPAGAEAPQK